VIVHDPRVDDRVVARRRRVELAAERVEDLGDLEGRVGRGALEEEVLEEVADARARVVLVTRARPDPEADRDRADRRQRLGDDARPPVQRRQKVVLHGVIVLRRSRTDACGLPCEHRFPDLESRSQGFGEASGSVHVYAEAGSVAPA
jgi:hypothetical protein